MLKRFLSILLMMILCMAALSACTGGESSVTPEETTKSSDPTSAAPTETEPVETTPKETEPPETEPPIDPSELHFAPEDYPVIDGSTATKPLAKAFQEALTGETGVEINHSKTGKAYTKLVDGEVDLILVVEPSEDNKAYADEHKVTLKLSKVANEGFVFFVNKRNPINSLTAEQIRKIYSGEITNWKEVGGNDAEIVAFQRPVNSGSQTGMESIVMGDVPLMEPVTERIAGSMEDIIDVISAFDGGENAIGYSYYYYANTMYLGENIKMIGVDGVMPNNTTICDMEYPFLTAYYAVTREGDESAATRDLLNYMLSEYGQVNVRDSGYVPVFDVGTAPSGDKEASDERTIHLSDTYDIAGVRSTKVTEDRNSSQFMCLQLDGLKDEELEKKVNQALWDNSEKAFSEGLEKIKEMSDKARIHLYAWQKGAFADLFSVQITLGIEDGEGDYSSYYYPITLSLSTGEEVRFKDLFKTDTEGKDIFNTASYSRILQRIGELRQGSNPDSFFYTIEDYNDVEDVMFDLITAFNDGKDIRFTLTPGTVTVYTAVREKEQYFDLVFSDFMEEITLFSKYPTGKDLYTGEYRAQKEIPILVNCQYADYGIYEAGENYYLNLAVAVNMEEEQSVEEVYHLFDQKTAYIRAEIEELLKAGKYVLYEGALNAYASDREMSLGADGSYKVSGVYDSTMLVLDSRDEFEAAYEKVLSVLRSDWDTGEPGLYTRGMYSLQYDNQNEGVTYQNYVESLFILKGYQAFRPYRSNRIKLEDLNGKTDEELYKMLTDKGLKLPDTYTQKGNASQVVGMVVKEIREHPERLTERNWTYPDPILYEAAERIADCIKP